MHSIIKIPLFLCFSTASCLRTKQYNLHKIKSKNHFTPTSVLKLFREVKKKVLLFLMPIGCKFFLSPPPLSLAVYLIYICQDLMTIINCYKY